MDISFVVVAKPTYPEPDAVIKAADALGIPLTLRANEEDGPLVFAAPGDVTVMYMLMPAPHPDAPHMPRGPTSPTAEALAEGEAHFVVTALGLDGTVIDVDTQLAALTAALIDATPAIGAMLGHGVVFHEARFFSDSAAHVAKTGELLPELVVDVTGGAEPNERMSFLTHGMIRYDREELFVTCPVKGKGALDFVFGMVRWLLSDPDKELPTGETVGRTPGEKVEIQRVPSPTGQGPDVIRLDLPT